MRIWEYILELLYPSRCAFCRRLTGEGRLICESCGKKLPYTKGPAQGRKLPHVSLCLSPLYYEGLVRDSLLRYKFQGLTPYAGIYGDLISKCVDENGISCDIITWVPLSRQRLRKRGYDQARLIAERLSRLSGVPSACLLRKIRNNPAQSGSGGPEKRRANVSGVYEALRPELFAGKTVLLVDDIVTTGATLSECARVLSRAGAGKRISAVAAGSRT